MNTGSIVAFSFSAAFMVLVFVCEYRWRTRLNGWLKTEGKIIGVNDDKESDCQLPIVEYYVDGHRREFISTYVLYMDPIGTTVTVVYDSSSAKAAVYSWRHRWFLTILNISLVILLVALAMLSH